MDNGYDSHKSVIYWDITYIKEWYQLKAKIPVSRGGISYGDRKIKCLQSLSWWVADLTLRGKIINLKKFKNNILVDEIEDPRIDFEDKRDGKGELRKTKYFSHEKWTQWEDNIYKYFASR